MADLRRPSELRKLELIDAALHIVATKGIAALTTRSLAEQVGLSSGAIFRHFASLDALLEAVVARVEAVIDATYPPSELPSSERLERFIEARSTAVSKQLGILRLVLSEQFLLALPKRASEQLSRCMHKTRAFVIECVRDGQETGEMRADVSAEALASIVIGTVQILALSSADSRRRTPKPEAVRNALLTLLRPPQNARSPGRKKSS